MIPVVTDLDKCNIYFNEDTFLSEGIYVQFPKSIVLENDQKLPILCTKIVNN